MIVTGAASGFGRATALRFAREGARVVVVDLDETAPPRSSTKPCARLGRPARGRRRLGVRHRRRAVATALDELGRLDVLVNNAGIARRRSATRGTWPRTTWDHVLRVDLRSVYVCSRAAIPACSPRVAAAIVNVASIAATVAVGGAAYAAAKGGIVSYTRHVGRELASRGVRVNCVSPGFMRSPMTTGERLVSTRPNRSSRLAGIRRARADAASGWDGRHRRGDPVPRQ